jgi:hypothetical protein
MRHPHLSTRHVRAALAFAALLAGAATPAFATNVSLATSSGQAGYGQWQRFDVSELDATSGGTEWIDDSNSLAAGFGSPLSFSFTIGAGQVGQLSVVDAGFAGDTFLLFNAGTPVGATGPVAATSIDTAAYLGEDFDAALANASFSHAVLTLGAGSYQISGRLDQSVQAGGLPLNSTVGAVQLTVSAVPEPATGLAMLAGLGLMGLRLRSRALLAR